MPKRTLCDKCKRPSRVCFCKNITIVNNEWPVHIIQYHKENRHPLNTAIIAQLSLSRCMTLLSNDNEYIKKRNQLVCQKPLLIYPGDDSLTLETVIADTKHSVQPRPLLFLDGTWRKTRRLIHESPVLSQLPKISIKPNLQSRYLIRKAPNTESLSTLEAIVYVLSILEKDAKKYQPLLKTMDFMINKQIEMMGQETFLQNYQQESR